MLKAHPTLSILNNPIASCMKNMYSIAKAAKSKYNFPKNNGLKQTSIDLKDENTVERKIGNINDQLIGVQPEG